MAYTGNKTLYTDTIKGLTDKTNSAMDSMNIMDDKMAEVVRRSVMSGVIDYIPGVTLGFISTGTRADNGRVYQPISSQYDLTNLNFPSSVNGFRIGGFNALINGYKLFASQNIPIVSTTANIAGIDLPAPPTYGTRDDLVFLEAWFPQGSDGTRLSWRIRTVAGVDFGSYAADGFARDVATANASDTNSVITPQGGNATPVVYDSGVSRWRTQFLNSRQRQANSLTAGDDVGLYVAGQGDQVSKDQLLTLDGYVYAIPLFRVKRRNSAGFRKDNMNGARDYYTTGQIITISPVVNKDEVRQITVPAAFYTSTQVGDYLSANSWNNLTRKGFLVLSKDGNNLITIKGVDATNFGSDQYNFVSDRPDGLYSNIIDAQDIIDLRHQVSLTGFSYPKLLAESFDKFMRTELQTNVKPTMVKEQYGLRRAPLGLAQALQSTRVRGNDGVDRDLVNLLGTIGNMELDANADGVADGWYSTGTSSTSLVTGGEYGKFQRAVTTGSGFGIAYTLPTGLLKSGSRYLLMSRAKTTLANPNGVGLRFYTGNTSVQTGTVVTGDTWQTAYVKRTSDGTETSIRVASNGTGGQIDMDMIRIYEIDQATYDKIDVDPEFTGDKLAQKFPYADTYPNFVENLIPSFDKWTLHANAVVNEPYKMTLAATVADQLSSCTISATESTTYNVQVPIATNGKIALRYLDSTGATISSGFATGVFTTPVGTKSIRVELTSTAAGTFVYTNPQLELGSIANPFVPYGRWYLPQDYLGNTHLGDKAIFHYEGANGGLYDGQRNNFSDAQVSQTTSEVVQALRTPQRHIKVTQATEGVWANGDKIEVSSYYGLISGVIDADTALANIINDSTASTNVLKVDDVSRLAVGDVVSIWRRDTSSYFANNRNITAIDTANKTVTIDGSAGSFDNVTYMIVETTTSSSVPAITATGIAGTWSGLGTKKATYTITTAPTTNTTNITLQYSVNYPAGKGLTYLPSQILEGEVNGQRSVTGTTVSVRGNFEGKVTANTDLNPHKSYGRGGLTVLGSPTNGTDFGTSSELVQDSYGRATALDGSLYSISTGTGLNGIAQHLFSFDLIRLIEDKYGEIPADGTASKVQWIKDNIGTLRANWWGYGSSPTGYKANLTGWSAIANVWYATPYTHANSSVTKLSFTNNTVPMPYLDSNGFAHFLAYADPAGNVANPSVAPTLTTPANAGSTLPANTYYVVYTWVNANGETQASPEASIAVAAGQNLVATIPTLPVGVTSANVYISTATGTETKQGNTTATYTQSIDLVAGAAIPASNTCLVASTIITDYVEVEVELKVAETGYTVLQPENPLPRLSENMLTASQAFPVDLTDLGVYSQTPGANTFQYDSMPTPISGLGSVKATSTYATWQSLAISLNGNNRMKVTAGKPYTFSAYVKSSISSIAISIYWYDASGNYISATVNTKTISSGWAWISVTGTSPSNAQTCYVDTKITANNGDSLYWGGGKFEQSPIATLWSEGRNKKKTLNLVGKVAGSTTENPHRAFARTGPLLTNLPDWADSTKVLQLTQSHYDAVSKTDGTLKQDTTVTSGNYGTHYFEFDLSHLGMSLTQLKSALRKLTVSWTGYGDGGKDPVADPTVAPTLTFSNDPGSTLPAGTYYAKYTWGDANGETLPSPEASITIAAGQNMSINPGTFPGGATKYYVYISNTTGTETRQGSSTVAGAYTKSDPLVAGVALPVSNTTGGKTYGAKLEWWTGAWTSSTGSSWENTSNTPSTVTTITAPATGWFSSAVTKDQKVYILVHSTYPASATQASEIFTDYIKLDIDLADYVDYQKSNIIKVRPETKEMKLMFPARALRLLGGGANEDNVALYYKHVPVYPTIATSGENATFLAEADGFLVSDLGNVVGAKQGTHHYQNPLYRAGMDRTDVFGDFGFGTIPFAADSKGANIGAKLGMRDYGFTSGYTVQYGVTSILKKPMVGIARYLVMHNNELKLLVITKYTNNGLLQIGNITDPIARLIPINGRPLVREQEGIQRAANTLSTAWRTTEAELEGFVRVVDPSSTSDGFIVS